MLGPRDFDLDASLVLPGVEQRLKNIGTDITMQLFRRPRASAVVSGILFVLGIIPGLPTVPFFTMSVVGAGIAWGIMRVTEDEEEQARKQASEEAAKPKTEGVENLLPLDLVLIGRRERSNKLWKKKKTNNYENILFRRRVI